jgi:hypothetical protein
VNASGYRLADVRLGTLGQPGPGEPFHRTTIGPGGHAVFDLVFSATTRCDLFPAERPGGPGDFTGSTFLRAQFRFSVLGIVPRTESLHLGPVFRVPQPSRDDCQR